MARQNRRIKAKTERFIQCIFETGMISDLMGQSEHLSLYHDNDQYQKTTKQIERVLDESSANAETYFYHAYDTIENAILENARTILKWLENTENTRRLTLYSIAPDGQPDGKGIRYKDKKLQECEAFETSLILKKADNAYGFELVTAYPNIMRETARPTYRNIRTDLHETRQYRSAKKKERREWDKAVSDGLKNLELTETDLEFAKPPEACHQL